MKAGHAVGVFNEEDSQTQTHTKLTMISRHFPINVVTLLITTASTFENL